MTIPPAQDDWVPDACTLPTVEQPIRIAEFDRFFAQSVRSASRPTSTRLELHLALDGGATGRELAARESGCCSFFTFEFDTSDTGPVMQVSVPTTYVDVLDAFEARVDVAIGGHR
ncbi:hypothetical protein [Nocardia sp. NPDC058480]|uniref:hypothetical protein n=1 Tax=unclassified Nocardia TaxID=2637762 RepID=UPI00364C6D6A